MLENRLCLVIMKLRDTGKKLPLTYQSNNGVDNFGLVLLFVIVNIDYLMVFKRKTPLSSSLAYWASSLKFRSPENYPYTYPVGYILLLT